MKLAVIGTRTLDLPDIGKYIPDNADVIISGGAKGIDECAKKYAIENGIDYVEIKPDYKRYGKAAPLIRNRVIVETADAVVAIWDGKSKGTEYVINECNKLGKSVRVYLIK